MSFWSRRRLARNARETGEAPPALPVEGATPAPIKKKGTFREYAEALITALLVALLLRSFVIEAFKVPSGSMLPSIMIGDHLFVNKFVYGLRLPLTKHWLYHYRQPQRGETVVFIYPIDEGKDFIKRVVGLPGDHIVLEGTDLVINGERVEKESMSANLAADGQRLHLRPRVFNREVMTYEIDTFSHWREFEFYLEHLGENPHLVLYDRGIEMRRREFIVPAGHLFVMGDNRDHSSDSRDWGFVPLTNLKGKAMFVWLSLDYKDVGVRWQRFGHWIE